MKFKTLGETFKLFFDHVYRFFLTHVKLKYGIIWVNGKERKLFAIEANLSRIGLKIKKSFERW